MQRITVNQLIDRLRGEADAYRFLEELRWANGVECPHCGHNDAHYIQPTNGVSRSTRTGAQSQRRVWRCHGCRRQFSVLTGTVMHGTKIPVRTWCFVIFEMCASKNEDRRFDVAVQPVHDMLMAQERGADDHAACAPVAAVLKSDLGVEFFAYVVEQQAVRVARWIGYEQRERPTLFHEPRLTHHSSSLCC